MFASWYASGSGTTGAYMMGWGKNDKQNGEAVGILMIPGLLGTETSWQAGTASTVGVFVKVAHSLCDTYNNRFITFATGSTWGNDTMVTRTGDAWTTAQGYGFDTATVHLVGFSAGCTAALRWAKNNLGNVASISLVLPAVDIQDIDDNSLATPWGLPEPSDAAAFGARPSDAQNPADNAVAFSEVPIAIWYSTDDVICRPETVEAFAADSGAALYSLGDRIPYQTGFAIPGHDAENLPLADVANFIGGYSIPDTHRPVVPKSLHGAGRGQ